MNRILRHHSAQNIMACLWLACAVLFLNVDANTPSRVQPREFSVQHVKSDACLSVVKWHINDSDAGYNVLCSGQLDVSLVFSNVVNVANYLPIWPPNSQQNFYTILIAFQHFISGLPPIN